MNQTGVRAYHSYPCKHDKGRMLVIIANPKLSSNMLFSTYVGMPHSDCSIKNTTIWVVSKCGWDPFCGRCRKDASIRGVFVAGSFPISAWEGLPHTDSSAHARAV